MGSGGGQFTGDWGTVIRFNLEALRPVEKLYHTSTGDVAPSGNKNRAATYYGT